MLSPILPPIFTTPNAFSMERSSIDACRLIVAVNASHNAPRRPLRVPYRKMA